MANLIDCLMKMSNHVELIEHVNSLRQAFGDHLKISLSHVAADKANVRASIRTNVAKTTHQGLDLAPWTDGQKTPSTFANLIDKSHVVVTLANV